MHRLIVTLALLISCVELVSCVDGKSEDTSGGGDEGGDGYDLDRDGYADDDCNDADAAVHPGAPELCDALDNNCDGAVDEGVLSTFYVDDDGDGFGDVEAPTEACSIPDGAVNNSTDCDDVDPTIYPGAEEPCDNIDNIPAN